MHFYNPNLIHAIKHASLLDSFLIHSLICQIELCDLLSSFIRLYRIILYIKIIFDQLPLFNPYEWPLVIIHTITRPYIRFFEKVFPKIRLGRYFIFDVSYLFTFEFLNLFLRFIKLFAENRLDKLNEIIFKLF